MVLVNAMVREIIGIYYGRFTADLCEMKFLKNGCKVLIVKVFGFCNIPMATAVVAQDICPVLLWKNG